MNTITKSFFKTAAVTLSCILINYCGKYIASYFNLPLWLDAFGTVVSAYLLGPFCGAVVGLSVNVIYSFINPISLFYGLTNACIGIIVGIASRRNKLSNLFEVSTVSVLVTLASVIISVPFNIIFWNGNTGNVWGDGVTAFLQEALVPRFICIIAGEFYIDFLDKLFTMVVVFLVVKIEHSIKRKKQNKSKALFSQLTIFALSFSCLNIFATKAQAVEYDSYIQTMYSSANGLPCGEANDIVQTDDGILWIGTYAGLYRYNGSEFKWMNEYDSVRNVNCLYVDEEGRLWIGTNDSGLSICINERLVNVLDVSVGLPSNSVRSIVRASDGLFYIGTSSSVAVVTVNTGLSIINTIPEVKHAASMARGKDGLVCAVTSRGELCLIKEQKLIYKTSLESDKEVFCSCMISKEGTIYAGTTLNRIFVYEYNKETTLIQTNELECSSLNHLNSLKIVPTGEFFVCADNGIGYFTDLSNEAFKLINLKEFNNSIDNMTIDYQGNLWFSSSRQGILRLSGSSFTNLYAKLFIKPAVVNSITEQNGLIYFATDSGLDIVDKNTNTQIFNSLYDKLRDERIRCLQSSADGSLWLSTYGKGLLCVKKDGNITTFDTENGMAGDRVRVSLELIDGTVIASGDKGLSFIKDNEVCASLLYGKDLPNATILSLMQLPNGLIMAGSNGDGIYLIEEKKLIKVLTQKDELTSGVILRTVISTDRRGVFIVTSNSLCYLDLQDFKIRALHNFPYFNNYDVWKDLNGSLFVLGSAGIYVVNEEEAIRDEKPLSFTLLDSNSGLNSALTANSWNYLDKDGLLYLSCGTGAYTVNMKSYRTGKHSYRMRISTIELDSIKYNIERSRNFSISRDVSKITIYPEVINYTVFNPTVRYMLEGFDTKPTYISQRDITAVTYTNLPSGDYTFHLSVLDLRDASELESLRYSFTKEKKIYDNRYFIIYMIFVFFLAVAWFTWFIFRTQIQRTLTMQKKELEFARAQMENLNLFAKFTNTDVANAIATKSIDFAPHLRDCSILFCDIRGFTSISDDFTKRYGQNSAEKIIKFLNDYLTRMVNCISSGNGTIDKFEGDAIMAVWGMMRKGELYYESLDDSDANKAKLKKQHEDHIKEDAINCVKSALAMRCALIEYNKIAEKSSSKDMPHIRIGCGINTGRTTSGIIGSEQKLEYTAIGDAVNMASRTESASKFCGTDILITQETYELVKDEDIIIEQIPIALDVKGKGKCNFYAVINMPSIDLSQFFDDDLTFGLLGAGVVGPKTLKDVRKLLSLPEPKYEEAFADKDKVSINLESAGNK